MQQLPAYGYSITVHVILGICQGLSLKKKIVIEMRKIFYLALWALMWTACGDDAITTTTSSHIDPPEEVGLVMKGTVERIDGSPNAGVTVNFHQAGKLLGTTQTDEKGNYSSLGVEIDSLQPVTVEYAKTDISPNYRRPSNASQAMHIVYDRDFADSSSYQIYSLENPSDSNWVKLYGTVVGADGLPIKGARAKVFWEYFGSGFAVWIVAFSETYTDMNGYFELLVPKGVELYSKVEHFIASPIGDNGYVMNCIRNFNEGGEIFQYLSDYEVLNPIQEDTELQTRNDLHLNKGFFTFSGIAQHCDGTPVDVAQLAVSKEFSFYSRFQDDEYHFGPNGEFEVEVPICGLDDDFNRAEYAALSISTEDYRFSSGGPIQAEGMYDFGVVQLCLDNRDYADSISVKFRSSEFEVFASGGDNQRSGAENIHSGFSIYDSDTHHRSLYLGIKDIQLGENPVAWIRYWKSENEDGDIVWETYEKPFDVDNPPNLVANITSIDGNYVHGSVTGTVMTDAGQEEALEINFSIYNK